MSNLVKLLEDQLHDADSSTSEVGEQRERNHRYYTMGPIGNERKGRSHYVAPVVLSSVESKKALFSEIFLSSRDVVTFTGGGDSAQEASAKTAYVNRVLKDNKYEEVFRDGWHDAFVAKRMAVWTDWDEDTEVHTVRVQGATGQQINAQMQQLQMEKGQIVNVNSDGLESFPIPSIGQPQFVHTGELLVEVDASSIKIELIAPEKFHRDPNATYVHDSMWVTVERTPTRSMLIDEGYDEEQVKRLHKEYSYSGNDEDFARKAHDQSYNNEYVSGQDSDTELVTTFKTRAWLRMEDDDVEGYTPESGDLELYEICWAKGKVLLYADGTPHIKRIDAVGVFEWTEMKISHAADGMATADVEVSTQKNISVIERGVLDNLQMTNNPRWEAVQDNLLSPRDLLDNVIGSVVWSTTPGSVMPLATPQLSQHTMPALEMLKQDSDERSGVSGLARGMNSAAVTNQNADNMIERLTNAGTRRVTAAARDFAKTFLVPLMQHIVILGMEHDKSQEQMEAAGQIIPIAPSQWQDDANDMEVAVALTPDEAQVMSQKLLLMHQVQSQDPEMAVMYGPTQRHALYDAVYELIGVYDSTQFLMSPTSPEYAQAMQQQQAQQQQMQQEAQEQKMLQQEQLKIQAQNLKDQSDLQWSMANNKIMDTLHDNQLDDRKFIHEVRIDNEELALEAEQDRGVSVG